MAINLKSLSKPTGQRPIIATLFGEGGMGKTTLAAMFPKPVFIRTEDGTASLQGNEDVSLFPLATSSEDVLGAIEALATEKHNYKTVVIDSITQLATMIESEIVAADPKAKSISQAGGGYGAGYGAASEKHRQIREWAGALLALY
jgi:RecA/RadA recombinase